MARDRTESGRTGVEGRSLRSPMEKLHGDIEHDSDEHPADNPLDFGVILAEEHFIDKAASAVNQAAQHASAVFSIELTMERELHALP